MKPTYYVSTPIYYPNGKPHIGHAYSSLLADILARHHASRGYDIKFSTGVDENSQKIVEKAQELNIPIHSFLDEMAQEHRGVWDSIGICYTDFIRTTEDRHAKLVTEMLQRSYDAGDIYQGEYHGLYCGGCEAFKTQKDLTPEGVCPDHPNREIQHIHEKNWFFRLSRYQDALLQFYQDHPDFIVPKSRYQEVIEFVRSGLEDFSISRETNSFGIPLPFDPSQVAYVWFDALYNYVTVCQGEDSRFWPANLHVIGKDIIRFHAIYWPAMLLSSNLPLPKKLLVTGYLTVEGQKISKSLGNVIDPGQFIRDFSREVLVLYLLVGYPIGQDGDWSTQEALAQYHAKLSNSFGNLLSRTAKLAWNRHNGKISGKYNQELVIRAQGLRTSLETIEQDPSSLRTHLLEVFQVISEANVFIDTNKPWKLPEEQSVEHEEIIFSILLVLYFSGLALFPYFPEKMTSLFSLLGKEKEIYPLINGIPGAYEALWELPESFSLQESIPPLFPKFQEAEKLG